MLSIISSFRSTINGVGDPGHEAPITYTLLFMSWHDMSSEAADFLSWRDMSRKVMTCCECHYIQHFVEEYQALDEEAVLIPYKYHWSRVDTIPPIRSPNELGAKDYFHERKYFHCTKTWLLLKNPVTETFIRQRELNRQKGLVPIYLRLCLWIQTALTSTDLSDAFEWLAAIAQS